MYMACAEITCDLCGECESQMETGKEVRRYLREEVGWVQRGSRDYCNKCKDDPRAKSKESMFDEKSG